MESITEIKRTMFSGAMADLTKTSEPQACIMIVDDDLDMDQPADMSAVFPRPNAEQKRGREII